MARKKFKAAALEFLTGYKCLTPNGRKRVEKLIKAAEKLYNAEKDCFNMSIDRFIIFDCVFKGMKGFLSGTGVGFDEFEKNKTLDKIQYLLK